MAVVAEWLALRPTTSTERDTGVTRHRCAIRVDQLERAANEEWTITRHPHIELRLRHQRFRIAAISPRRAQRTRRTARDDSQHVGSVRLIRLYPWSRRGVEHLWKVANAMRVVNATAGVECDGDVGPFILVQSAAHLFTSAGQVGEYGAVPTRITAARVDEKSLHWRRIIRATSSICTLRTIPRDAQDVATRAAAARPPFRRSERSHA